jgi:hypothetical protein
MYRQDLKDVERRFTKYGSVALAAAAVENVLDEGNSFADLHPRVRAMLDDFWRLIAEPVVQGKTTMTETEVRSLPSSRLYLHTRAIGEACSQLSSVRDAHPKAADLADGAFVNLLFIVWQLESVEALLNPGKPPVVPEDVAETTWSALVDGLERLATAARDPDRAFEWQKQTIARVAQDHPYAARAIGTPVPRAYFSSATTPPPTASSLPALETAHRLRRDEVERRFTEYALIALTTATIEQLLPAAPSDLAPVLSTLVEDLWSWQADPKPQRRSGMSKTEAATLPSSRFHARLTQLPSQPAHLVGVVRNAILFITWVMDGIERRMNPGKPFVLEDELEDDLGALLGLLEQAVEASRDPEAMLAWERQTIQRLRTRYPADRDTPELTLGEPVTRVAFQNATQ